MHITVRICVVIATLSMFASTALADDDRLGSPTNPKAQDLLEQANRHYRVKEFDKAVELYKAGALVEDAPVFLYNLGQCYRQLGEYENAIWHYERFLDRKNPDEEVRTYVQSFISKMQAELEQRAKTEEPTEPGPDTPLETPDDTEPDDGERQDVRVDAPAQWYSDTMGWALAGTGGVVALVGGVLLVNASGLDSDADNELDEQKRVGLRDKASTRRTWGTIGTIAGGGLLVVGIVKLMMSPRSDAPPDRGAALSIGLSWIAVTGTF